MERKLPSRVTGRKKLEPGVLNSAAISILTAYNDAHDQLSLREISRRTGISDSRMSPLWRCERAILLDDFEAICDALGLQAWKVLRDAQEMVAAQELADSAPASPLDGIDPITYTEEALARARLAASQDEYGAAANRPQPDREREDGE
ncbi:helix-turn-helix domain-containing protein [Actinobaculum suis]|uniref:helix-turn-helix domain-containing protein n=1 Tax=Actinobaculum suis TaxID=1657 RepID=UPI0018CDD517|nr:helix-turn-helix transcriptional regulator [Actinobaculum suis]